MAEAVQEIEHSFTDSLKRLWKHPLLLIPNVLYIMSAFVIGIGFLWISGIWTLFQNNPDLLLQQQAARQTVQSFIVSHPIVWFYLMAYFAILFLVKRLFYTTLYGMIRDVLEKNTSSFTQGLRFGLRYYFDAIGIFLILQALLYVPLLAGGLYLYWEVGITLITLAMFVLLALIYACIIFVVFHLFVFAAMTFEEKGPISSIMNDVHFVRSHLADTILAACIVSIGKLSLMGLAFLRSTAEATLSSTMFIITAVIVVIAVQIVVTVWLHVFVFDTYFMTHQDPSAATTM